MKYSLSLKPSDDYKDIIVDVKEHLGYTQEEWENFSERNKEDILEEYCYNLPEQPYWYINHIKDVKNE